MGGVEQVIVTNRSVERAQLVVEFMGVVVSAFVREVLMDLQFQVVINVISCGMGSACDSIEWNELFGVFEQLPFDEWV